MTKPLLRIPFPGPLPPPIIHPPSATSIPAAITAVASFLSSPNVNISQNIISSTNRTQTTLLTGAGISVPSGLSDYRGPNGTYRLNTAYKPIYHHEFLTQHASRKRYWARSFVGWPTLSRARPNKTHIAIGELAKKGYVGAVVTQNVDSLHDGVAGMDVVPVVELHGCLREVVCVSCSGRMGRSWFQGELGRLNPAWAERLEEMRIRVGFSGATRGLGTGTGTGTGTKSLQGGSGEKKLQINPDGDVDLPNAPCSRFRYPPCPHCLESPPRLRDGSVGIVEAERDGAISARSNAGILKPAVIMFGESVDGAVKQRAEEAVDGAGKLLVLGSSLATFSAWRLVERAVRKGMAVGILNVGGVRGEERLFGEFGEGVVRVRCSERVEDVLPEVAALLEGVSQG
ncbi:uncharacterized protein PADG_07703 [Paracoccidioides brasiliensis Pb18]|uniref:Deacetylase sirtuin-type domain-containing protein n=1 Tax=Paracoccidioides brasiliensis (strain Pb18) TaxID=502780 RepID=C1GKB7_PARBD|nr:uncharacterized protein PADG_07703 [Paracoccidioides brasiliensis Pb18]EEH42883.1 hypothetical protein PADG_07703 [Paracoccidioides brasiliensis Pb18]ODH53685.1 hypothetical protein GX48_00103 [Paracoccidioides brasiliensis]